MNTNQWGRVKNLTLSVLLVMVLFLGLASQNRLDSFLSVFNGYDDVIWYQTGLNSSRTCYCLGVDSLDAEVVSICERNGKENRRKLTDLGIPADFRPVDSYIGNNGDLFLGGRNQENNELYLLKNREETAELLLSVPSQIPYQDSFSHIAEGLGGYGFLLKDKNGTTAYLYDIYTGELGRGSYYAKEGSEPLAKLPDGTNLLSPGEEIPGESAVVLDPAVLLAAGQELDLQNAGIYTYYDHTWVLDRKTADLYYYGAQRSGLVMNLRDSQYGNIISMTVSGAGAVLLTEEGRIFVKENPISHEELTDPLHEAGPRRLRFALLCVAALAAVLLLFFLLEYDRRNRNSFVFRGTIFALGIIIAVLFVTEIFVLRPRFERKMEEYLLDQIREVGEQEKNLEAYYEELGIEVNTAEVDFMLESLFTDDGDRQFLRLTEEGGELYVRRPSGKKENIAATPLPGRYREEARKAFESENGSTFCDFLLRGRKCYAYTTHSGKNVVSVLVYSSVLSEVFDLYGESVRRMTLIAFAGCLLVIYGILSVFRRRVRSLSGQCDSFLSGTVQKMLPDRQDELGELSLKIENTILARNQAEREYGEYRKYCRSFLPEDLLESFGVESVGVLTPGYNVKKEADLMEVTLLLPSEYKRTLTTEFYEKLSESLLSISQAVTANGGILLSYQPYGVEAVFPAGEGKSVRAAVEIRQGLTALNKLLSKNTEVEMLIGLDRVEVQLGVVGDDSRMQILSRHNAIMDNLKLSIRMAEIRNIIVCTGDLLRKDTGVLKRYIGVYKDGERRTDLYEIYEGDSYAGRLAKSYSQADFEKGVRCLEAKDDEGARKYFLSAIENNVSDSLAICYLSAAEANLKKKAEEEQHVTG